MPLIDSFRDALMGATGIVGTAISDTFSGLDATALENPYDFAQQQTPIDRNYDMQSALAAVAESLRLPNRPGNCRRSKGRGRPRLASISRSPPLSATPCSPCQRLAGQGRRKWHCKTTRLLRQHAAQPAAAQPIRNPGVLFPEYTDYDDIINSAAQIKSA